MRNTRRSTRRNRTVKARIEHENVVKQSCDNGIKSDIERHLAKDKASDKALKLNAIKRSLKLMSGDELMELLTETVGGGSESNLIEWGQDNGLVEYTQSEIAKMSKGKSKKSESKASTYLKNMTWTELRHEARRCGINSYGKARIALTLEILNGRRVLEVA